MRPHAWYEYIHRGCGPDCLVAVVRVEEGGE